jgi:hypothetical protein
MVCMGLYLTLLLSGCKSSPEPAKKEGTPSQTRTGPELAFSDLPADFAAFYAQFHQDSLFQIQHIHFPLEGLPEHADPEFIGDEAFYWSPDQWVFQKSGFKESANYEVVYSNLADILIEEKITEKKYGLVVIRRFAKSGDGWNLIYYAGLNKYKPAEKTEK